MSYGYVVVGGGIHGTHVAHRLVSETDLEPQDLAILEPRGELLASFREKARACGMGTLRSPFVHHLGVEPFDLRDFAEARDREEELRPAPDHPRRPSLSLFLDHARHAIERSGIDALVIEAAATGIDREGNRLRIDTEEGPIRAERCVLAVGQGPPRQPDWARGLSEDAPLSHVWDESVPIDEREPAGRVCVVGGGVTAAHLAVNLAERAPVTLLARHELRAAGVEADPPWINWRRMERRLHPLPPGSETRLERVRRAHNTGSIPPSLLREVEAAGERGKLRVRRGEVEAAHAGGEEVVLRLTDGSVDRFRRAICATGFDRASDHPLVERVAASLGLETGVDGLAVLDDRSLEWRTVEDSEGSGVFVTGALGALTFGPLAGTIAGARRGADRLVEVHGRRSAEPILAD
ncbi:FAD/NAD(P)-binding protein [Halalkalicoccus tibetensis]|uniref:FAD/NAD(P)-binding protein n=1 Tax=Halalkalicoccus tibetensis TaxID=175632 RepID=A0ABD5V4J4_9EURY